MASNPEDIRSFLTLLDRPSLEAMRDRIASALVKNERYISLAEGGNSAGKAELVPTGDLMTALAAEFKRRWPDEFGKPILKTVRGRF